MSKSKNIHKIELGWFVWLENKMNHFQMMGKSVFWIMAVSFMAIVAAVFLSTQLGIFTTKLSLQFYFDFIPLSLDALLHSGHRQLWSNAFSSIVSDLGRTFLFHVLAGVGIGIYLYGWIAEKTDGMSETQFIKGTKIIPEDVRIAEIKKAVDEEKYKCRFSIGRIPMPIDVETNHTLIVASSGGGKGVLLTKVMATVGRMKNVKSLIHDNKPEWILKCYRPDRGDLIFNPLDQRSIKWTVWNDIHDIMDIKNFANWIVPDMPGAKDPFWQNSARGILESILLYLWKNDECTNAAIRRMINMPGEQLAEELVGLPGAEYAAKKDSLSTLKTQMAWVDFLPDGEFSIREWVEGGRGLLFLSNTEKTQALFKPVLTLFVNAVGSHVLNLPDDRSRRIFFFLDEFTSLSKLDKVIDLLKLGRSKGASLWIAFQDFQQLKKIYSDEDMRTVINNCKNIAVGQINEPAAAKYLSERFGKQEFYEKSQSSGMGVASNKDGLTLNDQRKEDFVVKDSDLLNLKERQFFVKINELEGVTQTTADIINVPEIAAGFIPVVISKEEQLALMFAKDIAEIKQAKPKKQLEEEEEKETSAEEMFYEDEDGFGI